MPSTIELVTEVRMSVSQQRRHELFSWFEEAMGSERAATIMDLLPATGWDDIATKQDVDVLRQEMVARFEALDHRFEALDHRFEALDHRSSRWRGGSRPVCTPRSSR